MGRGEVSCTTTQQDIGHLLCVCVCVHVRVCMLAYMCACACVSMTPEVAEEPVQSLMRVLMVSAGWG